MNVCRICLSTNIFRDVFELENEIKDGKSSVDIMIFCLDLKVTQDSTVSTRLCSQCFETVISFYNFKVIAQKNDEYFLKWNTNICVGDKVDTEIKLEAPDTNPEDENEDYEVSWEKCEEDEQTKVEDKSGTLKSECVGDIKIAFSSDDDVPLRSVIKPEAEIKILIEKLKDDEFLAPPLKRKRGRPKGVKSTSKIKAEVFACEECGKMVKNLERHMMLHRPDKLKCKGCDLLFNNYSSRRIHYRREHLNLKDYECNICHKRVRNLDQHNRIVHESSSLSNACDECPARFISPAALRAHSRVHTNEKPYLCHLCNNSYSTKSVLKLHVRRIHLLEKGYHCAHCDKKFFQKFRLKCHLRTHTESGASSKPEQICPICGKPSKNLRHHMQQHLPADQRKTYSCKVCDKVYFSHNASRRHYRIRHLNLKDKCPICEKEVVCLSSHMSTVHKQEQLKMGCDKCPRRFLNRSSLEIHLRCHSNERPYPCELCDSKFTTSGTLRRHVMGVHEKQKPFLCQICSKGYFKKSCLIDHIRSHENLKTYKCEECGKYMATSQSLREHRKLHTGDKQYACSLCDMRFAKKCGLRQHMVSHTRERNYPCMYCDVRFGRSDHRNRHQRTAHGHMMHLSSTQEKGPHPVYLWQTHPSLCIHAFILWKPPLMIKFRCGEKHSLFPNHDIGSHQNLKMYKCEECGKCLGTTKSLREHRKLHTGEKPYACSICDKRFVQSRSHENLKVYKCEECGKCMATSASLREHRKLHTGVKQYACSICDMRFAKIGGLSHHMISHTRERNYPCMYCDVRFGRSDHRNRHQRTAHGHMMNVSTAKEKT